MKGEDYAGKRYLEPCAPNSLCSWLISAAVLALAAAMLLSPLWLPGVWRAG